MNVQRYLSQAYRLDQIIKCNLDEVASLREMASSVSSPGFGERVQTSNKHEAPYIKCIEKIMVLEDKINKEVEQQMELREQIHSVIGKLENDDERMVLKYRYLQNYSWEQIGMILHASRRTIRRWHDKALEHVELPEDPIFINHK